MQNPNQLTELQRKKLGYVYDAIARLLLAEGRDFTTSVTFVGDQPKIVITGLTPLGKLWAKHCTANLTATIRQLLAEDTPAPKTKGPPNVGITPAPAARPVPVNAGAPAVPRGSIGISTDRLKQVLGQRVQQYVEEARRAADSRLDIQPIVGNGSLGAVKIVEAAEPSPAPQVPPAPVPRKQHVL